MKHIRILTVLLTLLTLCALCVGCTADPAVMPTEPEGILTNVFAGTSLSLPDRAEIHTELRPHYNPATGQYTFAVQEGSSWYLMAFDTAGAAVNKRRIDADLSRYQGGTVTADGVVVRQSRYLTETEVSNTLMRIALDGSTVESEDLSKICGLDTDSFHGAPEAVDAAGRVYYRYLGTVFVLNEALEPLFSLDCDAVNVSVLGDEVYIGRSDGLVPLNTDAQSLGERISLPEGVTAKACFAAPGYAMCFVTANGVYVLSEDMSTIEMLFSFQNSGLNEHNTQVYSLLDRDTVLLSDGEKVGIWHRGEDIDLSKITVLHVAYNTLDTNTGKFLTMVQEFNQRHQDIRVITRDYTVRRGNTIYLSEESSLGQDMITGAYRPDIFVTNESSPELSTIYENGMYMDLYPFLDGDPELSREDLLGCVSRSFETPEGKLSAIFGTFWVETLVGNASLFGDRTALTLNDVLTLKQNTSEEQLFMPQLTRYSASGKLFGRSGYSAFIDQSAVRCTFDSPEFVTYLNFLKNLPTTFRQSDYEVNSVWELIRKTQPVLFDRTLNGVADWMTMQFAYNGQDAALVGYISPNGTHSGAYINTSPYVMTTYCDAPEAAWLFIKEVAFDTNLFEKRFPTLKSAYQTMEEQAKTMAYGERKTTIYKTDNPPASDFGPYLLFTEEEAEKLYTWLDEIVGVPYGSRTPLDITNIINEEISAYLADVQSAEVTAEHIQSRVLIWLSEHE